MQHRYPNKRIGRRASNGQFARVTLQDVIGTGFNEREQECLDCGRHWTPIVKSGVCLVCGSENTQDAPPPPEIQAKIERYDEINKRYPMGIDPRDRETLAEAQRLYEVVRKWR